MTLNFNYICITAALVGLHVNIGLAGSTRLTEASVLDSKPEQSHLVRKDLTPPYQIRFKARMPQASKGIPDFGIPQVWFSSDYISEFDRLAFSIRGGDTPGLFLYDYQQHDWFRPKNPSRAHKMRYKRLPEPISEGQWFDVELQVNETASRLAINGKTILVYPRKSQPGAGFAVGGSWQVNSFCDIETEALPSGLIFDAAMTCLPVRTGYHPSALKYDIGPYDVAPQKGWLRIDDSISKDKTQSGWTKAFWAPRDRGVDNVEPRLRTLAALAHDRHDSSLRIPLEKGAYVVSVGVGDASHPSLVGITDPDGNEYTRELSVGQWGEVRFKVAHEGGMLTLPMKGSKAHGMAVCYLVVEPEDVLGTIALSTPSNTRRSEKETAMEPRRKQQRAAYEPVRLPALEGKRAMEVSLAGEWLFMPLDKNEDVSKRTSPKQPDSDWHLLDVPNFWNETSWWCFGSGDRFTSHAFMFDELNRTDAYTFESYGLTTACYRQWLDVPEDWNGSRLQLEFDAVASVCAVYVNGKQLTFNRGMFKPFTVDITDHIAAGQENLLAVWVNNGITEDQVGADEKGRNQVAVTVVITPDMIKGLPNGLYMKPNGEDGKQRLKRHGGIWQDVRIKVSKAVALEDVWPVTGLDSLNLAVTTSGSEDALSGALIEVQVKGDEGDIVKSTAPWRGQNNNGSQIMNLEFTGLSPQLWSPAAPALYDLSVAIRKDGQLLDQDRRKVGFRTFEVKGNKFLLNGKPYRWLGANQPPVGIKPNDAGLAKRFTELMKEGNAHGTRTHATPATKVWVDQWDQQGIVVSQEGTWPWLMIENSKIPSASSLAAWKQEWYALVRQLRGHPSIAIWTINNEAYFSSDGNVERRKKKCQIMKEVIAETRRLDPTRPIIVTSGNALKKASTRLEQVGVDTTTEAAEYFGDIDDLHVYAGTYQVSWLSGVRAAGDTGNGQSYQAHRLQRFSTPGRPMVSQEAATAYPSADTGHQESSYIQSWHAQTWSGNAAYEYRNPSDFLRRHARITKEQIEMARREDVAGWLAFSNATWYKNVPYADKIEPYPVHYAAAKALSPVLVSIDLPDRNYFAGQTLKPGIYLHNDDLQQRDFDCITIVFTLKDQHQNICFKDTRTLSAVKNGDMKRTAFEFALPEKLAADRQDFTVHLEASVPGGPVLSTNEYRLQVCSEAYVASRNKTEVYVSGAENKTELPQLLKSAGIEVVSKKPNPQSGVVWLAWSPDDRLTGEINEYVSRGGTAVVQHPEKLENLPRLADSAFARNNHNEAACEVAHVTDDMNSPLLWRMKPSDIAWWKYPEGRSRAYLRALTFPEGVPDGVDVLVHHVPPHGYHNNWKVEFPLVLIKHGSGKLIVSTMNFDYAAQDPKAARFFINLLDL
jgi:hypothetical protein